MATNIKAKFTKANRENDGLNAVTGQFVSDPHTRRVVVGIVRVERIVNDVNEGTQTPTVTFDHIEVVTDDQDAESVRNALEARFEERTGRALPPTLFDAPDNTDEPALADTEPSLFDDGQGDG